MFYRGSYARAAAIAVALGGVCWPVTTLLATGNKVQIEVTGNIKPYCGNSTASTQVNAGDPGKAGSATLTFTVECNAPFQYTMQSQNGAMRLVNAPAAPTREDRGLLRCWDPGPAVPA